MRVLFVEDDEDLGEIVKYNLEKEGFQVDWVLDGETALSKIQSEDYDILIIDIMLPKLDGIELTKRARREGKNTETPIIMLTALSDEDTKLVSFEEGADDYITKPFSIKELIARMRAVARRYRKSDVLEFEGIRIDREAAEASVDGKPLHLTKTEFELLTLLVQNPNRIFTREELLEKIWGKESEQTRTVDVYISRLRKKLGSKGHLLKTLPRLGYKLSSD